MASDLEAELELLRRSLEEKGTELRDVIREETQRKEAELQVALGCGAQAFGPSVPEWCVCVCV